MSILIVYLLVRVYWTLYDAGGSTFDPLWAQSALQVALWVPSCLVTVMIWRRLSFRGAWQELGLGRGMRSGLLFGLAVTAPMAAAAVLGETARLPGPPRVLSDSVLGPFAESVLFTGFLFTQLVYRGRWRVVTGLAACGLVFGLAHQQDVEGGLLRLLLTGKADVLLQDIRLLGPGVLAVGAGGAMFTWVFYRWQSLWPAIALHALMNFWWAVSGEGMVQASARRPFVSLTAIGQVVSTVFAVAATAYLTRRLTAAAGAGLRSPDQSQTDKGRPGDTPAESSPQS